MISLCMIVKNEIKYIEQCLEAVKPFVDEIIIADTGSTDGTLDILNKYDCKVYDFEWCDDYSKARNFSISKASNNWVLILDADELITDFNKEMVNKILKSNNGQTMGLIKIRSFVGTVANISVDYIPRFFNKKFFNYYRDIHEVPVAKFNFNPINVETGIVIDHFGYLNSTREEKSKNENYLIKLQKSLQKNYDPYIVYQLTSTYQSMKMFEEAILEADKLLSDKSIQNELYFIDTIIIKTKALLAMKKYEEALSMQQYYSKCQHNDSYLLTMGFVFLESGNIATAKDIFLVLSTKKEVSINRILVIFNLAEIYYMQENYKDALYWYEIIKKIDGVDEKIVLCKSKLA